MRQHPEKSLQTFSKKAFPSQQKSCPWFLVGLIFMGISTVLGLTLADWLTPSVLLIQTYDSSASAKVFGPLAQELCQAGTQRLKYRDTVVWLPFADRTEITKTLTLASGLDLLGQCQQIGKATSPRVGEHPGTSLMRLSDRLPRVIASQRNQGNTAPVVIPVLLHEAEPGPGQPATNWPHIRTQIEKITSDRGIVVITGPTGQLQEDLEIYLGNIPGIRLCPSANASACLEAAISAARHL